MALLAALHPGESVERLMRINDPGAKSKQVLLPNLNHVKQKAYLRW
jgi:hypothetical protein